MKLSVPVTANVNEGEKRPRRHLRQTTWQKRIKNFEKLVLKIDFNFNAIYAYSKKVFSC